MFMKNKVKKNSLIHFLSFFVTITVIPAIKIGIEE